MQAGRKAERSHRHGWLALPLLVALAAGCATTSSFKLGQQAERADNYDLAVVEYTKALRADPNDTNARVALDRAKVRASQEHYFRGRRLAASERHEEALVEFQLASELNPTAGDVASALRETRQRLRTRVAVARGDQTELQALVERARVVPPPGLDLPEGTKLPDSLVFSQAGSRAVFTAIARFAGLNVVFDPSFREETISVDLRNASLADALASVAASTRTFYRVTAQKTITIVPDTPVKRREYRRGSRPDLLSEQRGSEGSARPPPRRRRRATGFVNHSD